MDFEYVHATEAIESGIYCTYYSEAKKFECGRDGSKSLCFCGHKYANHDVQITKKKESSKCKDCICKRFRFVPQRPEECGQWWLPRRKEFKMSEWRAKCKCGHGHDQHKPNSLKCRTCSCFKFYCDFACISCDCRWEDHETIFEFEHDRMMEGKPIGEDYLPLKRESEELHKLVFKTDRNALPNFNRPAPKKKRTGGAIKGGPQKRAIGNGPQGQYADFGNFGELGGQVQKNEEIPEDGGFMNQDEMPAPKPKGSGMYRRKF